LWETDTQFGQDFEERYKRLTFLLNKSSLYASMLQNFMENPKAKGTTDSSASSVKINGKPGKTPKNKRLRVESSDDEEEDARAKRSKPAETSDVKGSVKLPQPALITGATLRDYQLEGVAWMISLHKNGISGILGGLRVLSLSSCS
jgi:ATP-dependent DNA helicase